MEVPKRSTHQTVYWVGLSRHGSEYYSYGLCTVRTLHY